MNRIIDKHGKRESNRLFTLVLLAVGVLVINSTDGMAAARVNDSCRQTSQAAARSCRAGAQSDYLLALGKCINVSDPTQQKACRRQALADLKDAVKTCVAQYGARQADCKQLGGAPYDPVINPTDFVATIDNPFYPLTPGTTFTYTGQVGLASESNVVFVSHNTKLIDGVTCVEVRDTDFVDGELTEDTLDWFAQDKDGNVWYFGENARQFAGGEVVGVEGSWTAGVDSAKPGIVMKAHPTAGDFYRQEFSLDTAEDMAEVIDLTDSVTVPDGSFNNCLKTKETSPLEPDALENKFYASGVGLLLTIDLVSGERLALVQITH